MALIEENAFMFLEFRITGHGGLYFVYAVFQCSG